MVNTVTVNVWVYVHRYRDIDEQNKMEYTTNTYLSYTIEEIPNIYTYTKTQ